MKIEFEANELAEIKKIESHYPEKKACLMDVLHMAQ